jgi:hypothetical protein
MIAFKASLGISFLLSGLSQVPLPSELLSETLRGKEIYSLSSKLRSKPLGYSLTELILTHQGARLERILDSECRKEPIGVGIPGFQPGTPKSLVRRMFGVPSRILSGYWPNTSAVIYDLIPNRVSLGFLFDKDSQRLRQTEASFADSVDSRQILVTLNSMLGCRMNEEIKRGLQQVHQRESSRYTWTVESLKGVIERDDRQRIYIGIWEADLH